MSVIGTTKDELRADVKSKLKKILADKEDFHRRQIDLIEKIQNSPEFIKAKNILTYYPFDYEFDLSSLILAYPDKNWILPRPIGKGIMLLFKVENLDKLKTGRYGLKVPGSSSKFFKADELDLIIMPALAYDERGYRLGQGAGYYDRLLTKVSKTCKSFGVIHADLLLEKLPKEKHDKAVTKVLVA